MYFLKTTKTIFIRLEIKITEQNLRNFYGKTWQKYLVKYKQNQRNRFTKSEGEEILKKKKQYHWEPPKILFEVGWKYNSSVFKTFFWTPYRVKNSTLQPFFHIINLRYLGGTFKTNAIYGYYICMLLWIQIVRQTRRRRVVGVAGRYSRLNSEFPISTRN